ncbi:MAG TPA: beta-N-acetylhexosaminidase, partial [Chloroflexia bacterium]|nr:beta-N-acetylhexosaminidase [Chloroflexia bacterium]
MADLVLLPYPRALTMAAGHYALAPNRRIVLEGAPPAALLGAGRRLQAALAEVAALDWDVAASALGPADAIGAVLRVAPGSLAHAQGYELTITPEQIVVVAATPAGVFYGVCTLVQILQQAGRALPALHIADWPDFAVRGILLDISRDKVPQMATLYALIDMLAGWKLNQVQLYTEHTFAYHQHPDVWAQASPITGDEILALDDFCRARHVELVPNQNSFGHMHRWLIHDRYAPLAETPGEFQVPWGTMPGPFSLCPEDPGSLALVRSLYDELLPHFSSRQVNVGCDETFDLGQGRSREACAQRGTARVYLDYLLQIYQEVTTRQHTMQFWGDIIVQQPALIAELPQDSVALEWGYDAGHAFAEHCPQFAAAGIPFYVCPGTSSWCSIAGRTDNALG